MSQIELLETIQLRLADVGTVELTDLISDVLLGREAQEVRVFRHTRIGTDLLVVLRPQVAPSDHEFGPSELGTRLAALLQHHGIVDHSVWVRFPSRAAESHQV